MEEKDWFVIKNIKDFTDKARAIVYNNFGSLTDKSDDIDTLLDTVDDDNKEEFDKLLSHKESLIIVKQSVKKQTNKKTLKTRYIINDALFINVIENLNSRLISNILNGLVQKGLVESAFDDESNDFIFWVKKNEDQEETPETD